MKSSIMFVVSLLLLSLQVVAVRADEKAAPPAQEPAIQLTRKMAPTPGADGISRDGIEVDTAQITNDPWNVKLKATVRLTMKMRGLTAEKLKGKRLAFQSLKYNNEKCTGEGKQYKVIWYEPSKEEIAKGSFDVSVPYEFPETGYWKVQIGMVDPVKHEWWLCTASLCEVKR